jgi:hypothetical protein
MREHAEYFGPAEQSLEGLTGRSPVSSSSSIG